MKIKIPSLTLGVVVALTAGSPLTLVQAATPRNVERETLELSKSLKPIPDEEWAVIAGEKKSEKYEIARGDTLYGISKRLFGDGKYWPKIWALNNGNITNPHLIRPKNLIAFLPGSGSSLPGISIQPRDSLDSPSTDEPASENSQKALRNGRSQEWRDLPPQSWEQVQVVLPPEVDPQGFDLKSKYEIPTTSGFELIAIAATETVPFIGTIRNANTPKVSLTPGDLVQVESSSEGGLQVGESYAITSSPHSFETGLFGRNGYSYPILGKVQITGVRDDVYSGIITQASSHIPRSSNLIPIPPRVKTGTPIPGKSELDATLLLNRALSTEITAQHQQAFIDRGSSDGVEPGMVFRSYQLEDPLSREGFDERWIVEGDFMVVQVSPEFSSVIAINSTTEIKSRTRLTLLQNVSDLLKKRTVGEKRVSDKLDDIESLRKESPIGPGESKELDELEAHPEPGTADPSDVILPEELPPPPPEGEELEELKELEEATPQEVPSVESPEPQSSPSPEPTEAPPIEEQPQVD